MGLVFSKTLQAETIGTLKRSEIIGMGREGDGLFVFWELFFFSPFYLQIVNLTSIIILIVAIIKSFKSFIFYLEQKKAIALFEEQFWSGTDLMELNKEIGDKKKYIKQKSLIEDIFITGMSEIERFKNYVDENKKLMPSNSHMETALNIACRDALWKMIDLKKWFYNFYIIFLVLYLLTALNFIIEFQNIYQNNPEENIYILFPIIFTTLLYLCYTCLFYICGRFHKLLEYKLISFCDDFLLIVERNSKSALEDG